MHNVHSKIIYHYLSAKLSINLITLILYSSLISYFINKRYLASNSSMALFKMIMPVRKDYRKHSSYGQSECLFFLLSPRLHCKLRKVKV